LAALHTPLDFGIELLGVNSCGARAVAVLVMLLLQGRRPLLHPTAQRLAMSLPPGVVQAVEGIERLPPLARCGQPFGPGKMPISRWNRKAVKGMVGDEWHVPPPGRGKAIRHVLFDAGRRKSFMHRRLCTPTGDPGSLTLFHAPPARHRLLSEHLTAEAAVEVSGPYGVLAEWRLQPGRDNHWLDCVSGCCTAESILGGRLRESVAAAVVAKLAETPPAPAENEGEEAAATSAKAELPPSKKKCRVRYMDF
jgi:hypothetical protein